MTATASPNGQTFIRSQRLIRTITIAKGMGIILVVIGHYFPTECPTYWKLINYSIYRFHMPLFFVLSGYLYGRGHDTQELSLQFLQKKFNRLIIPFISIALSAFVIKYFAGYLFDLKHPVSANSLFLIFITSKGTYFPLLWFVYSLFIIFVFFPILKFVLHSKYVIFFVSILLMFIKWPHYVYLNHVFGSLPFFSFGALFLKKIDFDDLETRKVLYFTTIGIIIFIFTFFIAEVFDKSLYSKLTKLILGISGSITIIGLAAIISKGSNLNHMLYLIGLYSMSIYLLHTLFSSPVRIINYQLLKTNYFVIPAIVAIFAGIFIPLLLEMYVLRKNRTTRKYILGLR